MLNKTEFLLSAISQSNSGGGRRRSKENKDRNKILGFSKCSEEALQESAQAGDWKGSLRMRCRD